MQSEVARNSITQSSAPFGNNSIFNKAVNEMPFSTRLPVDRTSVRGPGLQDVMEGQKGDKGPRLTSLFRTKGRLPPQELNKKYPLTSDSLRCERPAEG